MSGALLFGFFFLLLFLGFPVFLALGAAGTAIIFAGGFPVDIVPISIYSSLSKYSLMAIPMFVLTGALLERTGIAERLLTLCAAIVGRGPGSMALSAVLLCVMMGGVSGSPIAIAATVAGIVAPSMARAGYPRGFVATVTGSGAATDVLVPPSIALIIYSLLVPEASVPEMFAAGLIPGTLAGLAMLIPAYWMARRHNLGDESHLARPAFWPALRDASWGLFAKLLILGGLRVGAFTPTEAGVVAAGYSILIGFLVYRTLNGRLLYEAFRDAAILTGMIMFIVAFAGVFTWAVMTAGMVDPVVAFVANSGLSPFVVMVLISIILIVAGMLLEPIGVFMIFTPFMAAIAASFGWNLVWFGVMFCLLIGIGQLTPPMAENLLITTRITGAKMQETLRWLWPLLASMLLILAAVYAFPEIALWLPRYLGFSQ